MFGLGSSETLIIILVLVLLFGAGRIPELAKSLGKGIKEFRKSARDDDEKPGTSSGPQNPPVQ
jgi:sec-independent protein translocase protein TatA